MDPSQNSSNLSDLLFNQNDEYQNQNLSLDMEEKDVEDNKNIEILKEMGFNEYMIRKVYLFLSPDTVENAINLMTEENGIYQHDFYNRTGLKDEKGLKCLICGKEEKYHINYKENKSNDPNLYIKKNKIGLNEVQTDDKKDAVNKLCEVCYACLKEDEIKLNKLKCNHIFCNECWTDYIKERINSKVIKIKCMNYKCNEIVSEEYILKHIDIYIKDKYYNLKREYEIISNPNKKFCPEPDCDSFLELKNKSNKYVSCKRGHKICFNCLEKWHGDSPCKRLIDKDFDNWKKKENNKIMPKLQFFN